MPRGQDTADVATKGVSERSGDQAQPSLTVSIDTEPPPIPGTDTNVRLRPVSGRIFTVRALRKFNEAKAVTKWIRERYAF